MRKFLKKAYRSNYLYFLSWIVDKYFEFLHREEHWMRCIMNRDILEFLESLPKDSIKALEISGEHYKNYFTNYTNYKYPTFDLLNPRLIESTFQVVIVEQVLEHVKNPFVACKTIYDLTSPGGTAIINTPFLIRLHGLPDDYFRFTPNGLKYILESSGFVNVKIKSFGNKRCVQGNLLNWQKHRFYHSMRNDPNLPVMVWAFATKP